MKRNTLTCVYCGMAYPEGTPLRKAEETIVKLRTALVGLVGASGKDELEKMEILIRTAPEGYCLSIIKKMAKAAKPVKII